MFETYGIFNYNIVNGLRESINPMREATEKRIQFPKRE